MGALASDSIPSVCATMPSRASVELCDPCWHYSQNMCKCNGFQSKSEKQPGFQPSLSCSENLSEKNQGMNMSKICFLDYQLHDMLQNFEVHMGNA